MPEIKLQSDKNDCVTSYIRLINTLIDKDLRLTKGEIEVLTHVILKDDPQRKGHDRAAMLLDYKTVKEPIMFQYDMSQARMGNILSSLKRKKAILKNDSGYLLHPLYQISHKINDNFKFLVEWDIHLPDELSTEL